MKRKLIKLFVCGLAICPFWVATFFVSVWLGVALGFVGLVLFSLGALYWLRHGFRSRLHAWLNGQLLQTNWWQNRFVGIRQFVSNEGYRQNTIRNYDIVNLGSNPARFAFFYEGVLGQSWATGSQGQDMDFELLKYFHSYLKQGGTVLIPIMPFTAISPYIATRKEYWDISYYSKFYRLLDWDQKCRLPYADDIHEYLRNPLKYYPGAWRYVFRDVFPDTRYEIAEQPMMAIELEQDARYWMKMWLQEFNLRNLQDVFLPEWKKYYDEAVSINRKIVDFCLERGYKPVFICVPMTRYLSSKFPSEVRKYLVADFVSECNEHNIPFLDYTDDERFINADLFFNSFFMNLRGRKVFTRQVLRDLGID